MWEQTGVKIAPLNGLPVEMTFGRLHLPSHTLTCLSCVGSQTYSFAIYASNLPAELHQKSKCGSSLATFAQLSTRGLAIAEARAVQHGQAGIFAHHCNEELTCTPSRADAGLWLFSALPTSHSRELTL